MRLIALLLCGGAVAAEMGSHNDTDHGDGDHGDEATSAGSCYDMAGGHTVTCDVMEAMCTSPSM
jgi:hypothetical protein